MATIRFTGAALATAQSGTITVADTWAADDTASLTINGKTLTLTVGTDDTAANVATALKEMVNGDDQTGTGDHVFGETGDNVPEFDEITATVSGAVVTLTADTAGLPFVVTTSESTAGDGSVGDYMEVIAATGPNHWDNANNYDTGSVPVNGDDVYIDNTDVDILYGLGQSSVTLASLTIAQSFEGTIGLPKTNAGGYPEYRDDYLNIKATSLVVGVGDGGGSGRIKIDLDSAQSTVEIYNTGGGDEDGIAAVLLLGTNASNTCEVQNGSVAWAQFGGEVSTIATARVADGETYLGAGCTLTTVIQSGGSLVVNSSLTSLTQTGGESLIDRSGVLTNLTVNAGVCRYQSSGTVTNVVAGGRAEAATIDCSGDLSSRTFTNTTLSQNSQIIDPAGTIVYTNGIGFGSDVSGVTVA